LAENLPKPPFPSPPLLLCSPSPPRLACETVEPVLFACQPRVVERAVGINFCLPNVAAVLTGFGSLVFCSDPKSPPPPPPPPHREKFVFFSPLFSRPPETSWKTDHSLQACVFKVPPPSRPAPPPPIETKFLYPETTRCGCNLFTPSVTTFLPPLKGEKCPTALPGCPEPVNVLPLPRLFPPAPRGTRKKPVADGGSLPPV